MYAYFTEHITFFKTSHKYFHIIRILLPYVYYVSTLNPRNLNSLDTFWCLCIKSKSYTVVKSFNLFISKALMGDIESVEPYKNSCVLMWTLQETPQLSKNVCITFALAAVHELHNSVKLSDKLFVNMQHFPQTCKDIPSLLSKAIL